MLHGQTRYNMKSRFFDELPEVALKWITPKQSRYAAGIDASASWATSRSADSTAFSAPAQKDIGYDLRVQMKVFHTKFGEGTVLTLEGGGSDARAQVSFPRHGVKWLALSIAKLVPVP